MHALGRSCPWTGHAPAAAQRQRLCHSVRICRRACWQPVVSDAQLQPAQAAPTRGPKASSRAICGSVPLQTYHLRPCRAAQERSSATSTMDFPALSPSEQSLAEQVRHAAQGQQTQPRDCRTMQAHTQKELTGHSGQMQVCKSVRQAKCAMQTFCPFFMCLAASIIA